MAKALVNSAGKVLLRNGKVATTDCPENCCGGELSSPYMLTQFIGVTQATRGGTQDKPFDGTTYYLHSENDGINPIDYTIADNCHSWYRQLVRTRGTGDPLITTFHYDGDYADYFDPFTSYLDDTRSNTEDSTGTSTDTFPVTDDVTIPNTDADFQGWFDAHIFSDDTFAPDSTDFTPWSQYPFAHVLHFEDHDETVEGFARQVAEYSKDVVPDGGLWTYTKTLSRILFPPVSLVKVWLRLYKIEVPNGTYDEVSCEVTPADQVVTWEDIEIESGKAAANATPVPNNHDGGFGDGEFNQEGWYWTDPVIHTPDDGLGANSAVFYVMWLRKFTYGADPAASEWLSAERITGTPDDVQTIAYPF